MDKEGAEFTGFYRFWIFLQQILDASKLPVYFMTKPIYVGNS